MLVSIVIPCYNSQDSLRKVVELTMAEFEKFDGYEVDFFLVDDCSPDDTYGTIKQLASEYPCVHGYTLMRNFGQHNGLMCGLNHADGDLIMGMDDDLQTHPSQIPALLNMMATGDYDVVYGVFKEHANGAVKNFTSWLNKVTAQVLLDRPKDVESSNYWLITSQLRDQVVQYKNYNPYIQALFGRMTKRIGNVEVEHHKREQGTSNYTLGKLVKLWLSYFNYTVLPLRILSAVGVAAAVFGVLFALYVIIHKILVPDVPAGWSSLICILTFFFGLILLALGIIGEYLANLVLPANGTPQFIVRGSTDEARSGE